MNRRMINKGILIILIFYIILPLCFTYQNKSERYPTSAATLGNTNTGPISSHTDYDASFSTTYGKVSLIVATNGAYGDLYTGSGHTGINLQGTGWSGSLTNYLLYEGTSSTTVYPCINSNVKSNVYSLHMNTECAISTPSTYTSFSSGGIDTIDTFSASSGQKIAHLYRINLNGNTGYVVTIRITDSTSNNLWAIMVKNQGTGIEERTAHSNRRGGVCEDALGYGEIQSFVVRPSEVTDFTLALVMQENSGSLNAQTTVGKDLCSSIVVDPYPNENTWFLTSSVPVHTYAEDDAGDPYNYRDSGVYQVRYKFDSESYSVIERDSGDYYYGYYDYGTRTLSDGIHTLYWQTEDYAGNINTISYNIGVDTQDPSITVNTGGGNHYTSAPTMNVDFSDNVDLDYGYYKIDSYSPSGQDTTGWISIFSDYSGSSYTTDFAIDSSVWSSLSEGSHTVYFKCWDDAHRINDGALPSWQFYKDSDNAPDITVNNASGNYLSSCPILDVDFSDMTGLDDAYYKVDSYSPSGTDNTGWTQIFLDHTGTSYTTNFAMDSGVWNSLSEGSHTIYFKAWDDGVLINDGASPSLQFYKNTNEPTITVNTANGNYYSSAPTIDVDFSDMTGLDDAYYKVDSYSPSGTDNTGWTQIFLDHTGTSYTTNFAMDSGVWNSLSEGSHTIYFKAWDDGVLINDGASPSLQFYKDSDYQENILPELNNPNDIQYKEGEKGYNIIWRVNDPNVDISAYYEIYKDNNLQYSDTWTSGNYINVNVDGLSTGVYNYTIIVYDGLGGIAQDSVIVTVVINFEPMIISIVVSAIASIIGFIFKKYIWEALKKIFGKH